MAVHDVLYIKLFNSNTCKRNNNNLLIEMMIQEIMINK